jgi:hypothetical protein
MLLPSVCQRNLHKSDIYYTRFIICMTPITCLELIRCTFEEYYLLGYNAVWTQPLAEMNTRNLPGGKGRPERKDYNLTAICEPIV